MEDNSVKNILLMNKENCALKLVDEIILYLALLQCPVVCLQLHSIMILFTRPITEMV